MESPQPPPVPSLPAFAPAPPPVPNKDADNLRLLAIFHYVVAGLAVPFLAFLVLHYSIMRFVFTEMEVQHKAQPAKEDVPPFSADEFFGVFQWFYLAAGLFLLVGGIITFISGRCIAKRTHRTFSQIVAGLSCLHFPFGMILGIFTLVVLTKESVARLYSEAEAKRG